MSSLEVSELLPCTCASLSPDGRLLAYGADAELVVRGVAELEAVASWPCPTLSALSWSPDGRLLLASPRKASFVLLFDPGSSGWRGRVDEAGGGLACARWAPCSRAVLTAASFGLTLTAWSLRDGAAATALPRPKWPARGLGFTPDGALACLLLRGAAGRDAVAVLACGAGWAAACRFEAASADATDLAVCSAAVCLVDAPQAGGGAALHALDGALLGRFAVRVSGAHLCVTSTAG